MKLNLAILLTLFRIAAIPAVVICFYSTIPNARPIAAILFGIAAVTDFIDGWVARKFNQTSRFGEFLDPVADKRGGLRLVCREGDAFDRQAVSPQELTEYDAVRFVKAPPGCTFVRLSPCRDDHHTMACVMVPAQ